MQLFQNDPSDDHEGGAPQNPDGWHKLAGRSLIAGSALFAIIAVAALTHFFWSR